MVRWMLPLAAVVSVEWKSGCNATPAYSSNCDRIWPLISMASLVELGRSRSCMRMVANWSGVMRVSWRFHSRISLSR